MPLSTSRKAQITLLLLLSVLLLGGFLATSLVSYSVSRASIRAQIVNTELPLTSDNIYSEIQKDLTRPTQIARADRALYRAKQSGRNRVCEDVSGLQQ